MLGSSLSATVFSGMYPIKHVKAQAINQRLDCYPLAPIVANVSYSALVKILWYSSIVNCFSFLLISLNMNLPDFSIAPRKSASAQRLSSVGAVFCDPLKENGYASSGDPFLY